MKRFLLPLFAVLAFASCKKQSTATETPTLDVVEKNMSVIAKRTATWCGPCGGWGFTTFAGLMTTYDGDAVFMAWKDNLNGGALPDGDHLFTEVGPKFNIGNSTPTFFTNFVKENATTTLIDAHKNAPVVANSNYEFTTEGSKVNIKTTTKFFTSTEGNYYLAPYMIVDHIVASQKQSDNSYLDVEHHKYVARIAKPNTLGATKDFGYKIAGGSIASGYTVNLDFETTRDLSWAESDISFGMVIFKEQGDSLVFVNAYTK